MKCFTAYSLLALCIVATSHGFFLKEQRTFANSALSTLSNSNEDSEEEAIIKDDNENNQSTIESVEEKKEPVSENKKKRTQNESNFIKDMEEAKINAVKSAIAFKSSKLAALKNAKQTSDRNVFDSKFADFYSAISSNVQKLHQYKLNLKDKATSLVNSVKSNLYSKFNEEKALFSKLKKRESPNHLVFLQPIAEDKKPTTVYTYVKHEPVIVGTVYVPEYPVHQTYETIPPTYETSTNTYDTTIIPS